MASDYGNLGILYVIRWDLDAAEEMYKKSLAINEQLGRKEGMASAYGSLGILYLKRGDLDAARSNSTCSRDLYAEIGMPHMAARCQTLLDLLDAASPPASE
jgi:tetratricopeptide (TPR) repeat protein